MNNLKLILKSIFVLPFTCFRWNSKCILWIFIVLFANIITYWLAAHDKVFDFIFLNGACYSFSIALVTPFLASLVFLLWEYIRPHDENDSYGFIVLVYVVIDVIYVVFSMVFYIINGDNPVIQLILLFIASVISCVQFSLTDQSDLLKEALANYCDSDLLAEEKESINKLKNRNAVRKEKKINLKRKGDK